MHYQDGFELGDYAIRYVTSGSISTSTTTPFGYGKSLALVNGGTVRRGLPAAVSTFYAGFAHSRTASSTIQFFRLYGDGGAQQHLGLVWTSPTTLSAQRLNVTMASGTTVVEPISGWSYIEVMYTVADAGGRCVVKVDGDIVIDFTGDTKSGGTNNTIDAYDFYRNQAGTNYFDDLYVNDTGFLGPSRVYTLAPTGAGSETAMTPSTGANWSCVDEQPYSATDYVTGSSGQRDLYALGDLPAGSGTIHAVQVASVGKKSDAGALSIKNSLKSGATVYAGTATALSASDSTLADAWTVDPATSAAWTSSAVNALEAGVEVV